MLLNLKNCSGFVLITMGQELKGPNASSLKVDIAQRSNSLLGTKKIASSTMNGSMVIDTQANGLVAIYFVCLNFPLTILSRHKKYSVTTRFYLFQRKWKIAIKP